MEPREEAPAASSSGVGELSATHSVPNVQRRFFQALIEWDDEAMHEAVAAGADVNAICDVDHTGPAITEIFDIYEIPEKGDLISKLVKLGADVDATDRFGNTALHRAVEYPYSGASEAIEVLLKAGARVDHPCMGGISPLHLCGAPANMWSLVDSGLCDVNDRDHSGLTPLHGLMYLLLGHDGDIDIAFDTLIMILQHGADLNAVEYDNNMTPLTTLALELRHTRTPLRDVLLPTVRTMLHWGADPSIPLTTRSGKRLHAAELLRAEVRVRAEQLPWRVGASVIRESVGRAEKTVAMLAALAHPDTPSMLDGAPAATDHGARAATCRMNRGVVDESWARDVQKRAKRMLPAAASSDSDGAVGEGADGDGDADSIGSDASDWSWQSSRPARVQCRSFRQFWATTRLLHRSEAWHRRRHAVAAYHREVQQRARHAERWCDMASEAAAPTGASASTTVLSTPDAGTAACTTEAPVGPMSAAAVSSLAQASSSAAARGAFTTSLSVTSDPSPMWLLSGMVPAARAMTVVGSDYLACAHSEGSHLMTLLSLEHAAVDVTKLIPLPMPPSFALQAPIEEYMPASTAVDIRCLAASMDGHWLAAGGSNSHLIVWDTRDKTRIGVYSALSVGTGTGPQDAEALVWLPDGSLAVSLADGSLSIWRLSFDSSSSSTTVGAAHLSCEQTIAEADRSPKPAVLCSLAVMSDGRLAGLRGDSGNLQLWSQVLPALSGARVDSIPDAAHGSWECQTSLSFPAGVRSRGCLTSLPDNQLLFLSPGGDQVLRIWDCTAHSSAVAVHVHEIRAEAPGHTGLFDKPVRIKRAVFSAADQAVWVLVSQSDTLWDMCRLRDAAKRRFELHVFTLRASGGASAPSGGTGAPSWECAKVIELGGKVKSMLALPGGGVVTCMENDLGMVEVAAWRM